MYQRKQYYFYSVATAILWMLHDVAIALPSSTGRTPLRLAHPNYSLQRQYTTPFGLTLVFLWGPVLPVDATLSSPVQERPYSVFQQQMRPINKTVRQMEELEDDRLLQCRDKGAKWEQCFFYGTDTVGTNNRGEFLRARQSPMKGGPPTW